MRRRVILKDVISTVKLSVFPIWCWPLPKDATRFKMSCMKVYHCWCIMMAMCLGASMLYGVSRHLKEPAILAQLLLMTIVFVQIICNIISYQVNYHHIQNITYKMEKFCELMKPHEEVVIRRYIDKCIVFYGAAMFGAYFITLVTIIVIPPAMNQTFPTLAEYPFDVFYQPLKTIIFLQQSVTGIMMAAQLCMNVFMALLLWFATARFEILIEELRDITNVYQLFQCIKIHQELFKYATEVALVVRSYAFISTCCSMYAAIITFLLIITHQPAALLFQFSVLAMVALSEVFMYAWPGEYLMFMCKNTAHAAYDAFKCDQSVKVMKCLQIIIMRSQKPIIISIPGLMPALSFNFFTSYCTTIFSYFTTLRVLMDDEM